MLISYNWLQSYFEEKLPPPEALAERITFAFAEIEGMEKVGDDTVFDIKVLPDRACYALSHRGVAYEVAAITGLKKKTVEYPAPAVGKTKPLRVRVEAPEVCNRYMARVVENVTQKAMPWVREHLCVFTKEHLEAVGQRSINPIVDGSNIVMFDRGQPLHAFDADKVEGGIVVRMARKGEKIITLDSREVNLDDSVLVIADEKSPLAIAGIKGGKKAEVTATTQNLILESASFDASYIRKASERLGIKTDASKRFENKFSASLAGKGMGDFTAYLFEMDKNISAGEIVDWYPEPVKEKKIQVTLEYIENRLGMNISTESAEDTLRRLLIKVEKRGSEWTLTPPAFRVDLEILEDIVEEVGRIVGYSAVPAILPEKFKKETEVPKSFYYEWKIREVLVGAGFSEVMTHSFSENGSIAILKPLAADKSFARPDLRGGFSAALKMNALNSPLFGTDETRIFEIGRVFAKHGEKTALAVGVAGPKKKIAGVLETVIKGLSSSLGTVLEGETKDGVFECVLDTVFENAPELQKWDITIPKTAIEKFIPFSQYPFIVRDVALFVSPDTSAESVAKIIKENAGALIVRGPELFDEFSKDGKKSLAFRLVFQSFDRTLFDEEVNRSMEKVYDALKVEEWKVR